MARSWTPENTKMSATVVEKELRDKYSIINSYHQDFFNNLLLVNKAHQGVWAVKAIMKNLNTPHKTTISIQKTPILCYC
jgi:hypothetical protein